MVTYSLDASKKSSKRKEWEWKRKKSRCYNKLYTVEKDRKVKYQDDEIPGFDIVFGG